MIEASDRMGSLTQKVCVVSAVLIALLVSALILTDRETRLVHDDEVINFAWSRDGKLIATSSRLDQVITVWSREGMKLKQIRRPSGGSVAINTGPLEFSRDNDDLIYTAAEGFSTIGDAAVSVLDWKQGEWVHHLTAPALLGRFNIPQFRTASDFRISPDGQQLLYLSGIFQFLTILSVPSGDTLASPHRLNIHPDLKTSASDQEYTAAVTDMQWRPNAQEFAVMTVGGTLLIFRGTDFQEVDASIPLFNGGPIAYSPNGRLLAVGKSYTFAGFKQPPDGAGSIAIVDRESLRRLGLKRLNNYVQPVREIVFRSDEELFFSTLHVVYSLNVAHLDRSEPKIFYRCSVICNRLHMSPDLQDLALSDGNDVVIRHIE
jgi:WD40 repeat protein